MHLDGRVQMLTASLSYYYDYLTYSDIQCLYDNTFYVYFDFFFNLEGYIFKYVKWFELYWKLTGQRRSGRNLSSVYTIVLMWKDILSK